MSRATPLLPFSVPLVLGTCVLAVVALTSCSKETSTEAKPSHASAIEKLQPFFRIPNYEDRINLAYGVPMHGEVVTSVDYELGSSFPATEFFETLQSHLQELGWSIPQYSLINSHESVPGAGVWDYRPHEGSSLGFINQWWTRSNEVILVTALHGTPADRVGISSGNLSVEIFLYHATPAKGMFDEYKKWHGVVPSARTDAPTEVKTATDSTAKTP